MAEEKKNTSAFTDKEREAMRERAREAREFKKLSGDEQVARKIAEMSPADQKLAKAIHTLVMGLSPKITTPINAAMMTLDSRSADTAPRGAMVFTYSTSP